MAIDHGSYRDRAIKYGEQVRSFDETATAEDMRQCADGHRRKYRNPDSDTGARARAIAEAAYCASMADRKARGR
jgi:hypothetical protein